MLTYLHYKSEYSTGNIRETTGILKEIVDAPWSTKRAKIMIGNKIADISYDNLIVLERN